jgi:carbon-monoxide dehydrogenase medium subunit
VRGAAGERSLRADEFFRGTFETALQPGELLTEIRISIAQRGSAFLEIAPRKGDFAIASAAALVTLGRDGRCAGVSLVLGGVAPVPVRCHAAERLLTGKAPDDATFSAAAAAIPANRIELDSRLASRAYRRRVAPVLAKRTLAAAAQAAGALR